MARYEQFWDTVCDYALYLQLGFMIMIFLFVLSVIALLLADPGTGAFAISVLNFAMVAVVGGVLAWMNRVCANRARRHY